MLRKIAVLACVAAGSLALVAVALAGPAIRTNQRCYLVGQAVRLTGQGFSPFRPYSVTVDGVYFGSRALNAQGAFSIPLHPGGLPAGAPQHVDRVKVSDGTAWGTTNFTVTRSAGARVLASGGAPPSLMARFQVWGYSLAGSPRSIYVHYLSPSGKPRALRALGPTGGACGYLMSKRLRLFGSGVAAGTWTLQVDTRRAYTPHPGTPVTRIRVVIR